MEVELARGYVPGSIGRIVEMHGTYYHRHAEFGLFFEAKVARELAGFLSRCDERRDGLWLARVDGRVEGSIVIDGLCARNEGAHLRWFVVSDSLRGKGAGNALLSCALKFCRERQYGRVYLWTFAGLHPARHLYEKHGFQLTNERPGVQWGKEVSEQRFEWGREASEEVRTCPGLVDTEERPA